MNVATGNLVLQAGDEHLSGRGLGLSHLRTYNSLGAQSDGDGDGWRWDGERTVVLAGTNGAAGSTVTRTDGDGHETVYSWNGSRYASTEGGGAHDGLVHEQSSQQWVWTDGSSRLEERYAVATGKLASQQDLSGNKTTFQYESGRLTGVTDLATGQKLVLVYETLPGNANLTRLKRVDTIALTVDASGRATNVPGTAVKQVDYAYDTATGRLLSVRTELTPTETSDNKFYITDYAYEIGSNRVVSITQSDGSVATFAYESGKVKTVVDANGTQTFTYRPPANGRLETDISFDVGGSAQVWTYVCDGSQRLLEIKSPPPVAGAARLSTQFEYHPDDSVKRVIDAKGNGTAYEYDVQGNRRLERDPFGNTIIRTFDQRNQVVTETRFGIPDPDGGDQQTAGNPVTTRFAYDSQARLRFTVSAEGAVSENRYGTTAPAVGLLTQTVRYTGARFTVGGMTPPEELTEAVLAAWASGQDKSQVELTDFAYDLRGNLSKQTAFAKTTAAGVGVLDAAAEVTEYIYDAHGDLLETVVGRGAGRTRRTIVSSVVRDGLGRVTQATNAGGNSSTAYDDANSKIQLTTAAGLVDSRRFDNRGRLVEVTQSGSGASRTDKNVYDEAGRLRMAEDPQGGREFIFYDAADRARFTVDVTGAVTGLEYDANGRVIVQTQYRNVANTSTWYDAGTNTVTKNSLTLGTTNVDVVVDTVHDRVTRYAYDSSNRRTTVTDAVGTVSTTGYDGRSLVTQQQTGGRVSRFFYDRDDRQVGVVDPLGYLTEYKYGAAGRLSETIRYNKRSPAAANVADPVWGGATSLTAVGGRLFEYLLPAFDPDGDDLVYSKIGTWPGWLTLDTTTGSAILKGTVPTTLTSYSVIVKADDQRTRTANRTVTITVVNTPPTWTTLPNSTAPRGKAGYSLILPAATDIEPPAGQLVYSLRSPLPAGLAFSAADRRISGTPTAAGVSTLTARVTDQQGLFAEQSFTVTVTNNGPTWTAVPTQPAEFQVPFKRPDGSPVTVPPATDPDEQPLTYSVVSKPAWMQFDPNTRVLSGTPTAVRLDSVELRAEDSLGRTVTVAFSVDVKFPVIGISGNNRPPTSAKAVPIVMTAGSLLSYALPPAVDPEGTRLTYSAVSGLPEGLSVNSATGVITGTTAAVGRHQVVIRTTDSGGQSSDRAVPLEVKKAAPRSVAPLASEPVEDVLAAWRPTDASGLRSYLYYDGQGAVVGSVDERGFLTETVYNAETNTQQDLRYRNAVTVLPTDTLASLKAKAGSGKVTTTVEFDDLGRVSRLIATDGTVTRNEYDNAGRLVREVLAVGAGEQRAGRTRLNAFGEATGALGGEGDATLPVDPTQPVIDAAIASRGARYEYDKRGRRAKAINPTNDATLSFYDGEDRLTHTINAEREVAETNYDANGQVSSVRRYATRITAQNMAILTGGPAAQLAGKLPAIDTVEDQLTTYEYDRRGLLTKLTDAEGFITNRTYNQFGQLETETRTISTGLGGTRSVTTRFDYDLRGELLSQTADVGGISLNQRTSYDGQGRPVRSVNGTGHAASTAYLDGGRTIEVTDPLGRRTRLEHDSLGRILRRTDPSQQLTRYDYDDSTQAESATSPENVRVTTRKNRHGEVAEVEDGVGGTTKYQYNKDGQLLKVIDATGATIRENTYDASGRLEASKDGRGMLVRLSYDAADRVRERKVESESNVTTAYLFNALGQTATVTEGKGTSAELITSYDYDRNGRLLEVVVDPGGLKLSTKYSYDGFAAVTIQHGTVDSPAQQVMTYEFDNLGRKTKQIDAPSTVLGTGAPGTRDLTTQYRYDAAGRLSRVIGVDGNSAWTVYDAAGQVTHAINAEGEVSQNTYDLNGRLIKTRRYLNRLGAATLAGLGDIAGPMVPAANANDQRSILAYDKDGRLRFTVTAVTDTGWAIGENRFDANSNVIETRRYDQLLPEDRIAALDTTASPGLSVAEVNAELTALGYGGEETLTLIQRTRFAYHANNRLRFTVDALGAVSENVYDPMGALVATVQFAAKPTLTTYTQNAISAAVDRLNPGNRVTRFAYDTQGRLRFTLRVAASDGQGKATQHLVSEQAYDALGRPTQTTQYLTPVGALTDYKPSTIATAITPNAEDRRQVSVYDIVGRQAYSVRVLTAGPQGKHQVTRTEYDALGRVTQRTAYALEMELSGFSKATLDAAVAANKTNKDRTTTFVYDLLGRQRFVVGADGSLSETAYDMLGRADEKRRYFLRLDASTPRTEAALVERRGSRALGDGATRGERYTYDKVGRLLTSTDAKGLTETNAYNGLGDRTNHTDKNGAVCTYAYDRLGRVFRKINPAAEVFAQLPDQRPSIQIVALEDVTYHDAFGNLCKTVERANTVDARTTDFGYDTLGRLTSTALPGYFADPAAAGADPLSVGKVHKDEAAGRFRRTVELGYDVFGSVVRTQTRTGLATNQFEYKTYDRLGRVKHDVDALNHVVAFAYTTFDEQGDVTRHGVTITGTPPNGSHWTEAEIAGKLGTDPKARVITTKYDNAGRKREVKLPPASYYHSDRLQRKNAPQPPLVTDRATTRYFYNAFDQVRHEAVKLDATSWQDTWRYFDAMGREVRTVDTLKHHTTKGYDPLGNLDRVVEYKEPGQQGSDSTNEPGANDSDSDRITAFSYNVLDQQTSVRRLGARYSEFDNDRYVEVNNARDVVSTLQSFTYDGLGRVLTQTDGTGAVTRLRYNSLGQVDQITEPPRLTAASGAVDPFRNPVTATPVTVLTLDGFGNVRTQMRTNGGGAGEHLFLQPAYDHAGNLTTTTDPKGNVSHQQVDYAGRVVKEVQPVSVAQGDQFTYSHNLERRYVYDAAGRQTHTLDVFLEGTQAKQSGVCTLFNAFGEVTEERKVWGLAAQTPADLSKAAVALYSYDNAGHVFDKTSSDGKTRFRYNLAGQVTRQEQLGKNPDSNETATRLTETGYDELGCGVIRRLPTFSALVDNAPTRVTPLVMQDDHDRWGNVESRVEGRFVRNDNGLVLGQSSTTRYEYNADNRPTIQRLPPTTVTNLGGSIHTADLRHELRYDLIGRLVEEVDISSLPATPQVFVVQRRRSRRYDSAGQMMSETDGTLITTRYAYDAHGNRVGVQNALGIVQVDLFDKNGNVAGHGVLRQAGNVVYNGGLGQTPIVRAFNAYQYDQANRRIGSGERLQEDGTGPFVQSFTKLDERGFARINSHAGRVTTCEYDIVGNKTRENDANDQARTWVYDADPDPADPTQAVQHIFRFGRLLSSTVGGNRTTGYEYDDFGEVKRENYPVAAFTNSFRNHDYHENGLLKRVNEVMAKGTPGAGGEDDYVATNEETLYDYTALGQLAKEKFTRTGEHDVKRFVNLELLWVYEVQPLSPIGRTTITSYDALGRISTLSSTPANDPVTANKRSSVALTYGYDELGNRRKVSATFTPPGSTAPEQSRDRWHVYDAEGRMKVVEGGITGAINRSTGTKITYDQVGRRLTAEKFLSTGGGQTPSGRTIGWINYREERYDYDDRNFLIGVSQRINKREYSATGTVPPDLPANGSSPWKNSEIRHVAGSGVIVQTDVYAAIQSNGPQAVDVTNPQLDTVIGRFYLPSGELIRQITTNHTGHAPNSTSDHYAYDPAGILRSYSYRQDAVPGNSQKPAFTNTYSYEYFMEFGGYKEKKITVSSSMPDLRTGETTFKYDGGGRLRGQSITLGGGVTRRRSFTYDIDDHVLTNDEATVNPNGDDRSGKQDFSYARGRLVSVVGSETINSGPPALKIAEFTNVFTPISASYPAPTVAGHVASAGDTLAGIAQLYFGDSSLWHLIAEANSIANGPTEPLPDTELGKTYRIPNVVGNIHNNANTFRPYNVGNIIGDSTPYPRRPLPPKPSYLFLKQFVVYAVKTLVAALVTAAIIYVGGPGGAVAAIAGGVGQASGEMAGQVVANWLGLQDGYDYRAVAAAGITGAITGGAGYLAPGKGLSDRVARASSRWMGAFAGDLVAGRKRQPADDAFDLGFGIASAIWQPYLTSGDGYFQWDGAVNPMLRSALNPANGWLFHDESRDWSTIVRQALNAPGKVAIGAGIAWSRDQLEQAVKKYRLEQASKKVAEAHRVTASQVKLLPETGEVGVYVPRLDMVVYTDSAGREFAYWNGQRLPLFFALKARASEGHVVVHMDLLTDDNSSRGTRNPQQSGNQPPETKPLAYEPRPPADAPHPVFDGISLPDLPVLDEAYRSVITQAGSADLPVTNFEVPAKSISEMLESAERQIASGSAGASMMPTSAVQLRYEDGAYQLPEQFIFVHGKAPVDEVAIGIRGKTVDMDWYGAHDAKLRREWDDWAKRNPQLAEAARAQWGYDPEGAAEAWSEFSRADHNKAWDRRRAEVDRNHRLMDGHAQIGNAIGRVIIEVAPFGDYAEDAVDLIESLREGGPIGILSDGDDPFDIPFGRRRSRGSKSHKAKGKDKSGRRQHDEDEDEGIPRKNTKQNIEFDRAMTEVEKRIGRKLTGDEKRRVHDFITGQQVPSRDIVDHAMALLGL
ncbi:putative Ig domain-containing protein [Kribbella catacumbae]|uniref:putative Ig domain-containing protein n=1 Tax=Kribbella catacumbae TaxID=460086 RepID=UPI00039A67F8|nr:putative Ig domain-containing protein [Kribbella catacumbae]